MSLLDSLIMLPVLLIACAGFVVIGQGVTADTKAARRKLLREERQEIINAVMNIKPMASSPDVRDTKSQVIDAITKRSL